MISDPELARLDRIESKIDKMSESLISLARAEEKIASIEEDRADQRKRELWYEQKLESMSGEIHDLTQKFNRSQNTFDVLNKLFWLIVVAITGAAATTILPKIFG